MAEVWRALDERLRRTVAVKIIKPQLVDDPEFLVRFFSEAQAAAGVSHPNVTTILDFGHTEGRPFFVMEFVAGGPLKITEPMDSTRALSLVGQVAAGAGAAHAAGIVHRDIKPPNILLTDEGGAKLADFGIASSLGAERLTATGAAIGSPYYVSPEQVTSQEVTPASDVYSLGVVLYELLTGRRPFEGKRATAIAIARVKEDAPAPKSLCPSLHPVVNALVMRCLKRDPDDRYRDGFDLAEAIDGVRSAPTSVPRAPAIEVAAALGENTQAAEAIEGVAPEAGSVSDPAAIDDCAAVDENTQELEPRRRVPKRRLLASLGIVVALLAAAASGLFDVEREAEGTETRRPQKQVERRIDRPRNAAGPEQR